MDPGDFSHLDVARFEVRVRARESVSLPPFLGSTLRGALGHALKNAVCVVDHGDCSRCSIADQCIYPYLFETPVPPGIAQLHGQRYAPLPFILEPPIVLNPVKRIWRLPAARVTEGIVTSIVLPDRPKRYNNGEDLSFGLMLLGRAIEYLPNVVFAIAEMARRGLGANRAPFKLSEVWLNGAADRRELIYAEDISQLTDPPRGSRPLSELISERLSKLEAKEVGNSEAGRIARSKDEKQETRQAHRLKLRFVTPARIRVKGDLQTGLSFELLVRSLLRRISTLAAVHGSTRIDLDYRSLIERARSVKTRRSRLRWWDLERYSNRQGEKLKVGGLIGEVEYEGEAVEDYLPLLAAGELIRVGTGASYGLGRYDLVGS